MDGTLLIIILVLLVIVLFTEIIIVFRKIPIDITPVQQALQTVDRSHERMERSVRDDIAKNREEAGIASRQSREELSNALQTVGDTLRQQLNALTETTSEKLEKMRETVEQRLQLVHDESTKKLEQVRLESSTAAQKAREEVTASLKQFSETVGNTLAEMGAHQHTRLATVLDQLAKLTDAMEKKLEGQKIIIDERLRQMQTDGAASSKEMREESTSSLRSFNESVLKGMASMAEVQQKQMELFSLQLDKLTESNQQKLDGLRTAVEEKLKAIQDDNAKQLDQVRATVDEKLQGTLEKRLGESFKQVSDRLEQVHKGLGEMQALATGVGDLKKMLTNVKTRGTWGEVQLGAMLEEVLTPDQYETNVSTKADGHRVEFAIKLPGRGEDKDDIVWLPIDAKFPVEDYQRLVEAQEKADVELADTAGKQLENRIKSCAKDICEKYLNPPKTTDFGILFLPTEGLFAEVIRRNGLAESVQRECRVVITGPTTLWSVLTSLQMGFRTLTIEKRSSEVWNLLAAVKTEWTKYGEILDKVNKKLHEASDTIEKAQTRTRVIGRKLKDVQALPVTESQALLMVDGEPDNGEVTEGDTPLVKTAGEV